MMLITNEIIISLNTFIVPIKSSSLNLLISCLFNKHIPNETKNIIATINSPNRKPLNDKPTKLLSKEILPRKGATKKKNDRDFKLLNSFMFITNNIL